MGLASKVLCCLIIFPLYLSCGDGDGSSILLAGEENPSEPSATNGAPAPPAPDGSLSSPPPGSTSSPNCMSGVQKELLDAHNQARAESRRCGGVLTASAGTLRWNCLLGQAAQRHANDMANARALNHTGTDGSTFSERIRDTGYRLSTAGENIAVGYRTVQSVVQGWLQSSGHCRNIMNESYTEVGLAVAIDQDGRRYWSASFARPR